MLKHKPSHIVFSGRRSAGLFGAVLALALLGAPSASRADEVLATVDGTSIRESDVALAIEDIGSQLPQGATEAQRKTYVLDYLIDLKIVARAAEREKLSETPEFGKRLAHARERLLMERLLGAEGEKAGNDAALRAYYADAVGKVKPEAEVRARHILTETEDQAKAALARAKGGEDFAKLAAELSKDPGSGKEGGDLGYFTKDRMVSEFAEAAFKLEKGQLSEPVKSEFGWHVIKVEDKRNRPLPEFETVKDQIARVLVDKAQTELILKLRGEAKVERKQAEAPAPSAPAPAAPEKK